MQYFTREQHDASNQPTADHERLNAEFDRCLELYLRQLESLLPRLPAAARILFNGDVSLHDGTLIVMRVGDDIHERFDSLSTLVVNKRLLSIELKVLNCEETNLFTLQYERIHRVVFDFPSGEPWYLRFDDPGRTPIDDWMADELTAVNDRVLRHEILFSSGATLLIEFEAIAVQARQIEGRKGLPYLDEPELPSSSN